MTSVARTSEGTVTATGFGAPRVRGPVPAVVQRDQDWRYAAFGLSIAAGILAGMLLEANLLTAGAAAAAIAVSLVSPQIGLVVLAIMGPLRMPLVIPPPGLNSVLVAAIILGCVFRLPVDRPRIRIGVPLALLGAFVLYAMAQQLPDMLSGYAGEQAHEIGYLFYQLATGLGAIVAAALVMRGRSPYPYLAALLVAAAIAAGLALATADSLPYARLANLLAQSDGEGRATGPFGNPNAFGQFLAYATVLALALMLIVRTRLLKASLVVVTSIMTYALVTSLSRGAAAALLGGVVVLAFTRSRRTGIAALIAAAVVAVVVYPMFVEWRLTNLQGDASPEAYAELAASDGGRLEAVSAAPALLALSPIFGIGFGQYRYFTPLVTEDQITIAAHNWYGTVLAEQGLLGIALWVLIIVAVVRALRRQPRDQRRVGYAVFASFAVGCFFLQPPTSFQLTVLPALVVTAALVARWDRRSVAGDVPVPPLVAPFDPLVAAARRVRVARPY